MDSVNLKEVPSESVTDEADLAPSSIDLNSIPSAHVQDSLLVIDKHISFATLHLPRPKWARLDVLPFIIIYGLLLAIAWPAIDWEWRSSEALAAAADVDTPEPLKELLSNQTVDDDLLAASYSFSSDVHPAIAALGDAPGFICYTAMFALPVMLIVHALTFLSAYWNVAIAARLRYTQLRGDDLRGASHVRVQPSLHCGSPAICELESTVIDGKQTKAFVFQKTKYIMNEPQLPAIDRPFFTTLLFPTALPLTFYGQTTGLNSTAEVQGTLTKFGPNVFDIPLPAFMDLFIEHAMAPFFVFQVFCVLLWCLDEYWYYSLMTLFMLVSFEATVVQRRLKHLQFVRDMRVPPFQVPVYREKKWVQLLTSQLLPGDIVSMTRTVGDAVCPCDMLILTGSAVVNEALLTGESIPQLKECIDINDSDAGDCLNVLKQHKRHILYGGTKLLTTNQVEADESDNQSTRQLHIPNAPNDGCICFVLKTGFYSSQGKLVRTILYSTERVSVNNTESLLFILFLLVFALIASGYVLMRGLEDENRSRYKLMLNCIMIITSVVPPELPMELSLAVNTSLMELARHQIFCTEPFRIPLAGAINVCCFDKTGTLTSDSFHVEGIAGLQSNKQSNQDPQLTPAESVDVDVKYVIAGCNSLIHIADTGLVGDPLEKSAVNAIQWTCIKNDTVESVSQSNGQPTHRLKILHRFAFSSHLKRMSCVVALEHETGSNLRVVVKGAAEVMESMFESLPSNYTACHSHFARKGARVLALGYRKLTLKDTATDRAKVRDLKRDQVEQKLTFAGFLVLSCPLKLDTQEAIKHLIDSSHAVVMITGDNTLTACSVASQLSIVSRPCAILTHRHTEGDIAWLDGDSNLIGPFDRSISPQSLAVLDSKYDLCVSGEVMDLLMREGGVSANQMGQLILLVRVFARTSPDQKELILTQLKLNGRVCLMCGDGTNDVGALKQAHVGVALIGDDGMSDEARARKKEREEKRAALLAGPPRPKLGKWQTMMNITKEVQAECVEIEKRTGKAVSIAERNLMTKARFESEMKLMQLEMGVDEPVAVRLGDASIASPFTSKVPFISSCIHILRQGRCTLVTTLQMFEILGINCLISAYSMSVLYLDGVKMGDHQMTVAGLSVAMFFLFISRSKPLDRLSSERPQSKLFTAHMMLSIMGQFALHMITLMTAVRLSLPYTPEDAENRSPDSTFKPNVLNTVVYLVSQVSTTATFVANYRGRPFMQGLRENTWLYRALCFSFGLMMVLASGVSEELNELMQLVDMPSETFRMQLIGLLVFDMGSTVAYSKLLKKIFAIHPDQPQSVNQSASRVKID